MTYGSGPKLLIAANHRHATVMVAPITLAPNRSAS